MKVSFNEFIQHLNEENRKNALDYVINSLDNDNIDIVTLYNNILTPALNEFKKNESDDYYIWKEHIRSSIIKTIIENCYPYVIKERDSKYKIKTGKKIAVICPAGEYHEIGARMVNDFFTLVGYDSIFVGNNTPSSEFFNVLKKIKLDYIAISVSNYYHLIETNKTIEKIKNINSNVKIIVGGNAFKNNRNAIKNIGANIQLNTFENILTLAKEDKI